MDTCVNRYPELKGVFDTIYADLTKDITELPHSDLIVADLVIEYIGYECFQKVVKQICPKYVSAIIQVNVDTTFISNSPYFHEFDRLEEVHHPIEEIGLINVMEQIGYKKAAQINEALPNRKRSVRVDFAS